MQLTNNINLYDYTPNLLIISVKNLFTPHSMFKCQDIALLEILQLLWSQHVCNTSNKFGVFLLDIQ